MKLASNLLYGRDGDQRKALDMYLPDGRVEATFLYFHGGGLLGGDKADGFEGIATDLVMRGIAFVSANYRMYPEVSYPSFICDAAEAVAFVRSYMKERGCERLYVGGSSAGAYLSMMLCFDARYLQAVGLDPTAVAGYFHDAGQPTAHFTVLRYRGEDERRVIVDESAPLYYVGRQETYPPMRFLVSDHDIPNRYEQTMLMLSTLKHFGCENADCRVMSGGHCETVGACDEAGNRIFAKMIAEFVEDTRS